MAVEDILNDLLANLHLLLLSLRELLQWLSPTALSLLPTKAWIEIGHFLSQCLQGAHQGSSGRELLPNSNRIWIVVRDFEGLIYTPVRVFRNWTPEKRLVKPNNVNPGDSIFVGLPSGREARRVVHLVQIAWPDTIEQ